MNRSMMIWGSLAMATAVVLGAFGAHGLDILTANKRLATWKTATDYHVYHAIALMVLGLIPVHKLTKIIGVFFLVGISIFSGSLYLLSITNINWLGVITPIGGLSFIAGWITLAYALYQQKKS